MADLIKSLPTDFPSLESTQKTNDSTYYVYYEYEDLPLPKDWRIGLVCAFGFNITLSIIGNVIVLIVLICGRTRTDLNAFLVNLALADLTMATFCMPFSFPTIMYGHWIFGSAMCPTVVFLQQVAVFVSIYTLSAIGIDRYFAVIHPLKLRLALHRNKVLFASIWLTSISLAVVQTIFARTKSFFYDGETIYFCTEWWPYTVTAKVYEIIIVMITYIIPLIVLTFTYAKIAIRLWGRNLPGNADSHRDKNHTISKKRVIKMLMMVVLMFAVCWLPLHVFNIFTKFSPYVYEDTEFQDRMRKINCCVLWIAMSNSFMNPFIYSFFNDGFRADMKSIFLHCKRPGSRAAMKSRKNRSLSDTSMTVLSNSRLLNFCSAKPPKPANGEERITNQDMQTTCFNTIED
ncbi:neuromedin-K receptor-like [Saccoglossus kowalevskii]